MNHSSARSNALLLMLMTAVSLIGGCSEPPPVTGDLQLNKQRSQKLMALASDEAGKIVDADVRLTRQLNLADVQIARDWADDAKRTLTAARKTLESPEAGKLNDHARISGWVSISELSRRIKDPPTAATATEAALVELDKIVDPSKRCEYVMGISNELQYVRGKPAAAAQLARAGPWTNSIDNLALRRQALIAFSTALFNLDAFDAGQQMLGQEKDAAWRSDVLASMAQMPLEEKFASRSMGAEQAPAAPAAMATTQPSYGKNLEYDQVFKNQKKSQTSKD